MRRIGSYILCALLAVFLPASVVYAAPDQAVTAAIPAFDASFDNNKGAFYANGTPVTISADGTQTRVSWAGGSILVPNTVRVFGGGTAGSIHDSSDITMTGGTVSHIYGGGFSVDETQPANVNRASIKITSGTVGSGVYGGGLLYSEVGQTTIHIEKGTIQAVLGGGAASAVIAGVSYNSGTQEHPELSGTRVDQASILLKDGTYHSVWGGGQGYSYTKEAKVSIQGGTIDYVTAGGSNGLTENVQTEIRSGIVRVYQSVNRGLVKEVNTIVTGAAIETFYVGGETAPDVTGTLNGADIRILGGSVATLRAGTSNSLPIIIAQPDYRVSFVTGTVTNNEIEQGTESFSYTIQFKRSQYRIPRATEFEPKIIITTTPTGYESMLDRELISFSSSDDTVVMINSEGTIIGLKNGTAQIWAKLFDQVAVASVEVRGVPVNYVLQMIFTFLLGIVLIALFIIFAVLRKIFCFITRCDR